MPRCHPRARMPRTLPPSHSYGVYPIWSISYGVYPIEYILWMAALPGMGPTQLALGKLACRAPPAPVAASLAAADTLSPTHPPPSQLQIPLTLSAPHTPPLCLQPTWTSAATVAAPGSGRAWEAAALPAGRARETAPPGMVGRGRETATRRTLWWSSWSVAFRTQGEGRRWQGEGRGGRQWQRLGCC